MEDFMSMRGKMEYDEGVVCDAPCCNIVVVADTDISSSSPHPPPPPPRASAGVRRPLRGVNNGDGPFDITDFNITDSDITNLI